jgi:hypothetical protein
MDFIVESAMKQAKDMPEMQIGQANIKSILQHRGLFF